MTIFPAILTDSIETAQHQLDLAQTLPEVTTVQIDVIDGLFADNVTITPADLPELEFGELYLDLHLLVEEPLDYVYELLGVLQETTLPVRGIFGQVEKMSHQLDFLDVVKKHDWLAGLSLDIFTPLEEIDAASWLKLDLLQLMAIEAGHQEQPFLPQVLTKIELAHQQLAQYQPAPQLIIDGAVNLHSIPQLAKQDVQQVAVGSALWQSQDIAQTFGQLARY